MIKETCEKIRAIEREIDKIFLSHNFMKLPYSLAIQYLLIIYEEANRLPIIAGKHTPLVNISADLGLIQNNKYGLTNGINWASVIKDNYGKKFVFEIDAYTYKTTSEFFLLAVSYQAVVSAFTMWSRGVANATLINEKNVRFEYPEDELKYDSLDLKLSSEKSQRKLEELTGEDDEVMFRARDIVERTVKRSGKDTISYSIADIEINEFMFLTSKIIQDVNVLPEHWGFQGIAADSFKRFWNALVSICMLHAFALFYAVTQLRIEGGAIGSTILLRSNKNWIGQLARWTRLPKETVSKIIELHTYSSTHKKADIILTPFIKITENHLALAPSIITTNNLSRNLLKHLAKNFKNDFDKSSNVFEDDLIANFTATMIGSYFRIFSKKKISDKKTLPDIDVCLIDEKRKQVMFCEFKWTIPAAEPSEILEKREVERKASSQLKMLKEYFVNFPCKIAEVFDLDDKKLIFEKYFFVGVLKNCVGTAFMHTEEFSMIEYSLFCKFLNEKTSLEEVFVKIKNRSFLPRKGTDYELTTNEIKMGEFKISWTGYSSK